MKSITIEVPDDVNIVCTYFICTQLFNTWVLNSSFQPKDGLKVIVHEAPDEAYIVVFGALKEHDEKRKQEGKNGKTDL